MPKSSKLLSALDRHKGRNIKLEKQREQEKAAAKRKQTKNAAGEQPQDGSEWEDEIDEVEQEGKDVSAEEVHTKTSRANGKSAGGASPRPAPAGLLAAGVSAVEGSYDESESDAEEGEEDESGDIPLSDVESLDSEDKEDLIPHQRLTINNTAALLAAHKSIAMPTSLSFSENQSVTSATQTEITDVHDDLTRELAFYKQCLEAAVEGRERLKKDGVPFTRPNDYFAEMVKTDEHMGKIKAKMVEEAAGKKAAAEARKQRDLKKFGKAVQVAKLQERDRAKKQTLDKINVLKRKRKGADTGDTNEADLFDVALDNEIKEKPRRGGKDGQPGQKRQKRDAKFGFGGKKKYSKSGDAMSSGDLKGFSARKMKGGKKGSAPRPGKSKRANRA